MTVPARDLTPLAGLSAEQVADRVTRGQVNTVEVPSSRSVSGILRANVLTRFNAIISVLLALVLVFGDPKDALFGLVMVLNAVIGIVQELRAKHTLDRLRVLTSPKALVRRDGGDVEVDVRAIVRDDLVLLRTGDQVPVDGPVIASTGIQVDESLLTGESEPVDKEAGDDVLSGSFVLVGTGVVRAEKIGPEAYATRLAEEAKRFTLTRSELKVGIDGILRIVTWILVPTSILLFWSQVFRGSQGVAEGVVSAVAGVEGMVPQGLVLLTSMALAVAVIRLGRRKALVQELPAVETLARVDVVCLDKTGTLTEGDMVHVGTERIARGDGLAVDEALAAIAAAEASPNPTLIAVRDAYPNPPGWESLGSVPFSSRRKWSSATFAETGTWVLGAPDVIAANMTSKGAAHVARAVEAPTHAGRRVLLLAHSDLPCPHEPEASLPRDLAPVAVVVLVERIRPDAAETVAWFEKESVALKVISGDSPGTVGAIAHEVGVPGDRPPLDARELPEDPAGLASQVEQATVFGRVTPLQKQAMVDALQSRGHTVAMTGDGVNDVLALKAADMGIAMGSGTAATRAVAQLILLDGRFSVLPGVVAEGRRVIANMERVATLFLTKTVYSAALAWVVGILFGYAYPFRPIHLTFVGAVTIGIPAFFLSFESTHAPARPGFLERVLRRAVPSGAIAAVAVFVVYEVAQSGPVAASLAQCRTAATVELTMVGLYVLFLVARPLNKWRGGVLVAMVGLVVAVMVAPPLERFFDLPNPPTDVWIAIVPAFAGAVLFLEVAWRRAVRRSEVGSP